ncbi:sigma-70 family RNA polymerase sigma factor [Parabacteroides sp. PF5-6]|uniref:RNA polymerase sigma factor n=1 Tax=Parabacteroides sp. PF5-6 TaxID=1742403 RepID=UPI0024055EC0|nr:sigma-70 family RNA polymerase sigma factor [Parabacteroides sp. PF5-6]MDF9831390.1 RNA polymerase sigma-70 factor (family 1) [Parabacteroides sp. PF5-6]
MIINRDEFYITELKNDSHRAFSCLYDIYADSLYGFVLLHTKSTFLSEEIVQDTFIKIWTNRHKLNTEGSFKSLLFTMAKHQLIDSFRSQINKIEFVDFIEYCEEQHTHNPVEEDIYYEDFYEKLTQAKQILSERQRLVFELSREKGLELKAIADTLGVSEQTVKNQLSSALKTLREKLKEYSYYFW